MVFAISRSIPGDPVDVMLGENASPAQREEMIKSMGLREPLWSQWRRYILNLARLDLGTSLYSRRKVADLLWERLPATFFLAGAAVVVALLISLPLGTLAALRKGSIWDRGAMFFALLGPAVPNFWLGPLLLLLFSYYLGWFPIGGYGGIGSVVLPALTLGTAMAAIQARMIRNNLLDVLDLDYVRAAQARGLPRVEAALRHALVNALLPVVTVFGLQAGALLTGALVTEQIFSWPGIGQLTVEAIQRRDYPLIQGCILTISTIYILVNLLTDFSYVWLDPRIRLGERDQ